MTQLTEFMLLFRYEPSNEQPTQAELQEMQKHWGQFIGGIAMQGKLVSTHQLGFEGKSIFSDHSTKEGYHSEEGQIIGGNMILKADSIESAAELAKKCPVLAMGGVVEVRNVIPMN
ncbi:MAG: YciI family protein [Algoriphagus sp.]|nr:YciI family protein [Algoriphagus sp.]